MKLIYATESDINIFVKNYLQNLINILGFGGIIRLSSDIGIHRIKKNMSAIQIDVNHLVGVIEAKKPGLNVLDQPTVLEELLDQMMLIQGFYGSGPTIGILTTGEEWMVAWFPEDHDKIVNSINNINVAQPIDMTPNRASSTIHDPLQGSTVLTPSQSRGLIYNIEVDSTTMPDTDVLSADVSTDTADDCGQPRVLHTTRILNATKLPR